MNRGFTVRKNRRDKWGGGGERKNQKNVLKGTQLVGWCGLGEGAQKRVPSKKKVL